MDQVCCHAFDCTPEEAVAIQISLKERYSSDRTIDTDAIRTIAGADVAYALRGKEAYAAVVLLAYPELKVMETASVIGEARFPYIPGLLAFREGPLLLEAFRTLSGVPDLIFFDGHGRIHPRDFGMARHLGVILNKPTIGVAKRPYIGDTRMPEKQRGSRAPIEKDGTVIGMAVRTVSKVRPVFVSAGYLVNLDQAVDLTLRTTRGYRIPEPLRHAHILAAGMRRSRAPADAPPALQRGKDDQVHLG
jgi:deoxyribonuclease V